MARTTLTGDQVRDDSLTGDDIDESTLILNTIKDADGDTKVQVEESADEDKIRFDIAGAEKMVLDGTGLGVGTASPATTFHAYANVSNAYVATIDNDQASAGHVLKLSTDGNGSGSRLLEMEDGDGDVLFRARADGRFGFGPDGVDSMGAGTFVVGIDNSSHTADIAISRRLQHLGDSDTYLDFPSNNTFNLVAAGNSFLKYDGGNVLINNANADVDTKIMADNGAVVLHVDAGTNSVGIGTTGPDRSLDVLSAVSPQLRLTHTDGSKYVDFQATDAGDFAITGSNANATYHFTSLGHTTLAIQSSAGDGDSQVGFSVDGGASLAFSLGVDDGDSDKFKIGTSTIDTNTRLTIDASGNVGIGTTSPSELLQINAAADGDECFIQFQEAGADRAKVGINTSNNLLIHNQFINKHIVFKVNDQGNTREALRIDGAVSEVVVNQSSESLVDFRVESDNNTHMLFVDGSVDKVGINDSTPTSTLTIMGSLALSVLNINAANDPGTTYTIADTDCVILVNTRPTAQGGIDSAITLTLPSAASNPGMVLTIKDAAGYCDVNAITIQRAGGDTINGIDTSVSLPTPASWKRLISDGSSAWYEIGG